MRVCDHCQRPVTKPKVRIVPVTAEKPYSVAEPYFEGDLCDSCLSRIERKIREAVSAPPLSELADDEVRQ